MKFTIAISFLIGNYYVDFYPLKFTRTKIYRCVDLICSSISGYKIDGFCENKFFYCHVMDEKIKPISHEIWYVRTTGGSDYYHRGLWLKPWWSFKVRGVDIVIAIEEDFFLQYLISDIYYTHTLSYMYIGLVVVKETV